MQLFNDQSFMQHSKNNEVIRYNLLNADITLTKFFFTASECDFLFQQLSEKIEWNQFKIKIFGKAVDQPRLTAYYGEAKKSYSYSGIYLNPLPWNDELIQIRSRLELATGIQFTSVLLNYYRNGNDSMGWHSDDEKELGKNPAIASVSFGATRNFHLKHKFNKEIPRVSIPLNSGSLLLMKGATQHFWQHQIPKSSKVMNARINLTFRVI